MDNSVTRLDAFPPQILEAITSRLDILAVSRLVRASTRILREKLLHHGGIRTLICATEKPIDLTAHVTSCLARPYMQRPYTGHMYQHQRGVALRRPPNRQKFFEMKQEKDFDVAGSSNGSKTEDKFCLANPITTLIYASWNDNNRFPFGNRICLDELPSTLTYLDWESPPLPWRGNAVPNITQLFPNLVHLTLLWSPVYRMPSQMQELVASLPSHLQSLLLQVPSIPMMLEEEIAKTYPPTLTQLGLYSENFFALQRIETLKHLPVGLEILQLPAAVIDIDKDVPGVFSPQLTSLYVSDVSVDALSKLPPKLTELHLSGHSLLPPHRSAKTRDRYPASLTTFSQTFADQNKFTSGVYCQASLTRLDVSVSAWGVNGAFVFRHMITNVLSDVAQCANLRELNLPTSTLLESTLLDSVKFPPQLTKLGLGNVVLEGLTLPRDLEHIGSVNVLALHFIEHMQAKNSDLQIRLLQDHPFSSPQIKSIPNTVKTLGISVESLTDLSIIPSALESIVGLSPKLKHEQLILLPWTLTDISFAFESYNYYLRFTESTHSWEWEGFKQLTMENFRDAFRSLKIVRGGVFQLTSDLLPAPPEGQILETLLIPEDVRSGFRQRYDTMVDENTRFLDDAFTMTGHTTSNGTVTLQAKHITIRSHVMIPISSLGLEFLPGLVFLDISRGYIHKRNLEKRLFPILPDTIEELRLCTTLSEQVLWSAWPIMSSKRNEPPIRLPQSLKVLVTNVSPHRGVTRLTLAPDCSGLERLEINHIGATHFPTDLRALNLPPQLCIVDVDVNLGRFTASIDTTPPEDPNVFSYLDYLNPCSIS